MHQYEKATASAVSSGGQSLVYSSTHTGARRVATIVTTREMTVPRVRMRSTVRLPPSRWKARTICGTSTALRTPAARIANIAFGRRLAMS